jgi:NADPH-dependent 2,4-dienoyl-CoA reductase/sulfur reductase-like enzyme
MTETKREIETDLLVVGGGTTEFAAALAAARAGLRVRLGEAGSKVGGDISSRMTPAMAENGIQIEGI